jgi:hypothetical protein
MRPAIPAHAALLLTAGAALLSLAGAAWADDRPQPSTTPPPGPAYSSPSTIYPPSVVIDPMTGTSSGAPRDRQSDARGIPLSPLGDSPPGMSPPPPASPRR